MNFQPIVDAAVARYGGTASVAVSDGHSVIVAGDDRRHLALPTIKVPLSVGALRQSPHRYADAESAITWSDSAATSRMWSGVGAGPVAQVIAESGSSSGPTQWHGSTAWSASEQARFMANLSCTSGSAPVLDMIGRVTPDQRWGLGRIPGARFKGGWAPLSEEGGRWHVRQMGLVPGPKGQVAMAFTAVPGSVSFADSKAMNDMTADGIRAQLATLPTARCQ
ncbi:hypothetical protein [Corynebacterium cystitidis]|uniref:Beta-lactamase enzyme family protein n=1 Tax=Corynebacterium cystitidis DSM 20524 TaxID=1121357 RepID=A0A1H9TWX3_9CORY|nr:hypothetical protein [Corynebacterium cystitidis]WJY81918.1 hypothetical protein CCYS_04865 [Corynebacterium cystitidis DSM 20524]SES01474.1 hypothetical protein SAMN05661109_01589 [Corynebacterium cystitidis DSM 20524]SNV82067.1 putative secreted protein [Corynebacterium cystitidis]